MNPFCNVVIEILIENYNKIFNTKPFDKPVLTCYHNAISANNLAQTTIGLPQQQTQLTPSFLQQHQSNFNGNLISPSGRLVTNTNFSHVANLHQPAQNQFNFRHPPQQPTQLIQQQQQSNSFNYINNMNNLNFNCIVNPQPQQQFNSYNRPLAGMYNNWNSTNNLNLIDTANHFSLATNSSNNPTSNSFMPYNNNNSAIRALPATVQQNSQQSPTLPRPVHPASSNFYVSYSNPNSNCNLSNNSANTTNSSNSANLLSTNKVNSTSNSNLLSSIKNLTIDVNQPTVNTSSSSSSSSSSALSNLSQSLSKSNTTLNTKYENSTDSASSNHKNQQFNFNSNCVKPQITATAVSNPSLAQGKGRTVKSLYACVAGNSTELSFAPNTIIHDVHPSHEPGWLRGSLNGQRGLIPSNYVKYID